MKNKFQEKFLHENIFEIADLYKENNYNFTEITEIKKINVKEKYAQVVDLLGAFHRLVHYMENNLFINDHYLDLNIAQRDQLKNYIENNYDDITILGPNGLYKDIIKNMYKTNYFSRVMILSASLNLVYDKINNSKSYVISKNVTKILTEIGDITDKCPCKSKTKKKDEEEAKYFFYNNFESNMFCDLHAYSHEHFINKDEIQKVYTIFLRKKNSHVYSYFTVVIERNEDDYIECFHTSGSAEIGDDEKTESLRDLIDREIENIVRLIFATEIFIQDQPDLIQTKINEFSSKKKKREIEKKHYTSEEFNFVDMEYKHVKAYSDKSWYNKSTYGIRWCGTGRKEAKIVFIKGSTKSWKNRFKKS